MFIETQGKEPLCYQEIEQIVRLIRGGHLDLAGVSPQSLVDIIRTMLMHIQYLKEAAETGKTESLKAFERSHSEQLYWY